MLFEVSPVEDEDSKKKKASKRKKAAAEFRPSMPEPAREEPAKFIMSLDSVICERCGCPVDLAAVFRSNGRERWRVTCGWLCLDSWEIDPIPGLLDRADHDSHEFVMREGLHAGKTFDEIAQEQDGLLYIRKLVKLAKRKIVSKAAADWIARKNL
jgi:hypothetical protein